MTKNKLIYLGWTPEKLRERLQGCREGLRETYARDNPTTEWTYRFLFVELYLKYKAWLSILTKK